MRSKAVGELVHLPARRAVAHRFDAANYQRLRWLLLVTTPLGVILLLIALGKGPLAPGLAWVPALIVTGAIFFTSSTAFFERHGRELTMLYLGLVAVAVVFSFAQPEPAYAFAGFILPAVLLFLRLRWIDYLAVIGVDLSAMAWSLFRDGMPQETASRIGMAAGATAFVAVILWMATSATTRARDAFLSDWRREVSLDRERSRMRTELRDAREVQLSMLPVGAPQLDWVDFASVSLPASEVGGDYFDYFELTGSRLAIVIGDVAGHGMASGLVLSGVRSGLHLLEDELVHPVEVLRKLDRMLRATVRGRLFVTLQIALLDPVLGRLVVANAGHPPLLLASADGRVRRLGASGLPLGTRLPADFSEESAPLGEGDALLLFSDGVPEVHNLNAEEFGERRLLDVLRRSRTGTSARQLRDSLLNTLSRFKGDAPQEDDLTLVVARVGVVNAPGR